jgi:threonine/homoserine/homoserine lactone efflux protein
MPDSSQLVLFLAAAVALLVTPGPAVLYIVSRSIEQGRRAGLVSVLGIQVGGLVHVAAAALGLSALLVSSALAFNIVKEVGAAYLVFLGLRMMLGSPRRDASAPREPRDAGRLFRDGLMVSVLNPKTALFFLAFLPQFVDPARGPVARQVLLLGFTFVGLAIVSDGTYALLAGTLGQWLRGNARFLRLQRYVSGGVLVSLGLATAFSGSNRK